MSKSKYITVTDRSTLIRYLSWEYGNNNVISILATCKKIDHFYYQVPDGFYGEGLLKRSADSFALHIAVVDSYMQGKLKKQLTGSFVKVINTKRV